MIYLQSLLESSLFHQIEDTTSASMLKMVSFSLYLIGWNHEVYRLNNWNWTVYQNRPDVKKWTVFLPFLSGTVHFNHQPLLGPSVLDRTITETAVNGWTDF